MRSEPKNPQPRRRKPKTTRVDVDEREEVLTLMASLQEAMPQLDALLVECGGHWVSEDGVYRLYHQSYKVYRLQDVTLRIVAALAALSPNGEFNQWFVQIVEDGTGKVFERAHNRRWLEVTRPIVEAFFHARYFLEMAVRYGRELIEAPMTLPSGWASLLYLYGLR